MSAFDAEQMIAAMKRFAVTQLNATDDMVAHLLEHVPREDL